MNQHPIDDFDDDVTISAAPGQYPSPNDFFDDDVTTPAQDPETAATPPEPPSSPPSAPVDQPKRSGRSAPPMVARRGARPTNDNVRPPERYSAGGAAGEAGALDNAWSRTPPEDQPARSVPSAPEQAAAAAPPSTGPAPTQPARPPAAEATATAHETEATVMRSTGDSLRDRRPASTSAVGWSPPTARDIKPIQVSTLQRPPRSPLAMLAAALIALLVGLACLWFFVLRDSASDGEPISIQITTVGDHA